MFIANTATPYYAVIFTCQRTEEDKKNYMKTAELMIEFASKQEGFLGVDRTCDLEGLEITVSYWVSLEAIKQWKENDSHRKVKEKGKQDWYSSYSTRICKVEREYSNI